ncbi:diguanylate cyclase [Leeia sp.]|uniref:GGDEF domain-containing protein n=1 Tax=Leeia sp. TaxID=2884678 RepID=UPI0035AFD83A
MHAHHSLQQETLGEQARLLHDQTRDTLVAAPLAWLLLSYVLWPAVSHTALQWWLTLRIGVDLAYGYEIIHFIRRKPAATEARFWINRHLLILTFSGLAWGLSLPILSPASQLYELLLLLFLCGISGANIIIYAVVFRSCAIMLLTMWVPILWVLSQRGQALDHALALAGLVYVVVLLSYGWRASRLLSARISARLENAHLNQVLQHTNQELERNNAELHLALQRINELATHDDLTGCYNRRFLFNLLQQEQQKSLRYRHPVSLILLDLDHFKQVNDQHGHLIGDEVLRALVQRCIPQVRQTDTIARYGGEEFVIVMPMTEESTAMMLAERLREYIASQPILDTPPLRVTLSAGVAAFQPGESCEQWLDHADKALYAAKAQGRNRVVSATQLNPPAYLEHAS